jgi:hypothetical protein
MTKFILDLASLVAKISLPIFATLFPMKHVFLPDTIDIFSLFAFFTPAPSVLTIGLSNILLIFMLACYYLVAYPVGKRGQEGCQSVRREG